MYNIGIEHEPDNSVEDELRAISRIRGRLQSEIEISKAKDELTRVPELFGEPRWLAQIDGGAVDDLAGRSYTVNEMRNAIACWLDTVPEDTLEELCHEYADDMEELLSFNMESLVVLYKKLWEIRESDPKKGGIGPSWGRGMADKIFRQLTSALNLKETD